MTQIVVCRNIFLIFLKLILKNNSGIKNIAKIGLVINKNNQVQFKNILLRNSQRQFNLLINKPTKIINALFTIDSLKTNFSQEQTNGVKENKKIKDVLKNMLTFRNESLMSVKNKKVQAKLARIM